MELRHGMRCPACEVGTLDEVRKDLEFEYKGKSRTITNQIVYECNSCGEEFQNKKERRLLEKLLTDSRRDIDELLTSKQIRRIRRKFGMTQEAFAKALKLGEKNFARYESGQSMQGRSIDHLLRILDKYPQAIRVIGVDWSPFSLIEKSKKVRVSKKYNLKDFQSIETEECDVSSCTILRPTSDGY